MADSRHFENRYIAISQQKIIRFWWNFVRSSRFWTGWTSRDQKWKGCIGQTPSSTERIFLLYNLVTLNSWHNIRSASYTGHINVNVKCKTIHSSTTVLRGVRMPVWRDGFSIQLPSLNCPRLMDDERRCDGSAFQTAGAATWKLRRPSCVLVEGTSMSWRSVQTLFRFSAFIFEIEW